MAIIRVFTFNAIITYATAILILLATRFLLVIGDNPKAVWSSYRLHV